MNDEPMNAAPLLNIEAMDGETLAAIARRQPPASVRFPRDYPDAFTYLLGLLPSASADIKSRLAGYAAQEVLSHSRRGRPSMEDGDYVFWMLKFLTACPILDQPTEERVGQAASAVVAQPEVWQARPPANVDGFRQALFCLGAHPLPARGWAAVRKQVDTALQDRWYALAAHAALAKHDPARATATVPSVDRLLRAHDVPTDLFLQMAAKRAAGNGRLTQLAEAIRRAVRAQVTGSKVLSYLPAYTSVDNVHKFRASLFGKGKGTSRPGRTTMATTETAEHDWYVIDATDLVVGRLAVVVSNLLRGKHKPTYTPHCDTGDFVVVVNAEKVKFTGNKWENKEYQTYSHYAGGQKIIPAKEMLAKKPEEIIRLAVKRMMPRGPLGYKQITKLKVFKGPQHPHQAQQPVEYHLPVPPGSVSTAKKPGKYKANKRTAYASA